MRSNYQPGPYEPGPQGNDKGCMMNVAMWILAAGAMVAVGATNIVNRRKHIVVSMSAHDAFIVAAVAIVGAVLLALPAQAQDIGSGATSSTLYLPAIEYHFVMWFTDAELEDAMRRDGYDVETASMHTNCYLDASATPPDDLRYSSCEQYWIDGVATEGTSHYIWWLRLNDGEVHGIEVGGTMVSASANDAPCYVEDDGEVACG